MLSSSEADRRMGEPSLRWLGASVRGPRHAQHGLQNEDAWLAARGRFGTALVVCDGLGSRPQARLGAQLACQAVRDAAKHWARAPRGTESSLLRLIHLLWGLKVLPQDGRDCATTCLFALATRGGRAVVGRVGDGLAIVRDPSGEFRPVGGERRGFANMTTGLGLTRSLEDWETLVLEDFPAGTAVLLASDGVTDDLQPDRMGELVNHVVDFYGAMPPPSGARALRKDLRHWPTPRNADDRTLAVLWAETG